MPRLGDVSVFYKYRKASHTTEWPFLNPKEKKLKVKKYFFIFLSFFNYKAP